MTAPSQEPTEAMRLRLAKEMFEIDWPTDKWERHILPRGPDDAARRYLAMTEPCLRALLEQDTAARRALQLFVDALLWWRGDDYDDGPEIRDKFSRAHEAAMLILNALTPEPPSEKEAERG